MLQNLGYFAFLAPLVLFWQSARGFAGQVFSLLIRTDTIQTNMYEFVNFLQNNCKQVNFGNVKIQTINSYVNKEKSYKNCLFTMRNKFFFFYKKFIPIIVKIQHDHKCSVTYINFFDFNKLLGEYMESCHDFERQENSKKPNNFCISEMKGKSRKENLSGSRAVQVSSGGQSPSSNNGPAASDGFDSVRFDKLCVTPPIKFSCKNELSGCAPFTSKSKYFFTKEGLKILEHVESWLDSRDWYNERQINWKKSVLLTGKPGQGKSQLVLEVAKKLGMPIYVFDMAEMDNSELDENLNQVRFGSIVLFEDLDSQWEGRKNLHSSDRWGGITFEYFINKLSGVKSIQNCFVFATTNHPEKLDPALIRAGRFDEIIEIPNLSKEGKLFIAEKMLDLWPGIIDSVVNVDTNETAAEFEARVTAVALEKFWQDKNN